MNKIFEVTGIHTLNDLLDELQQLQEDYCLDDTYDDGEQEYTVPLIQQIRDRLDLLLEYQENEND